MVLDALHTLFFSLASLLLPGFLGLFLFPRLAYSFFLCSALPRFFHPANAFRFLSQPTLLFFALTSLFLSRFVNLFRLSLPSLFLPLLFLLVRQSPVVVGLSMLGIKSDGLIIVSDGLVVLLEFLVRTATAIVDFSTLG